MPKNSIIILTIAIIVAVILFWQLDLKNGDIPPKDNSPIVCTMEAKTCPDGSAVGRTGPLCEFAACPSATNPINAVVSGTVMLSPICPVERIPPDPKCMPKPYATEVKVLDDKGGTLKTTQSLSDGSFTIILPYGNYTFQAIGGNPLPRCSPIILSVQTPTINNVNISCDTGIR